MNPWVGELGLLFLPWNVNDKVYLFSDLFCRKNSLCFFSFSSIPRVTEDCTGPFSTHPNVITWFISSWIWLYPPYSLQLQGNSLGGGSISVTVRWLVNQIICSWKYMCLLYILSPCLKCSIWLYDAAMYLTILGLWCLAPLTYILAGIVSQTVST
jgi:hypothetical protein